MNQSSFFSTFLGFNMKLASKILAAFAVMASFSSFAGQDMASVDTTTVTAADMAAAVDLLTNATADQYAVITQATGSVAFIEQSGANRALISQVSDNSAAVIIQTGSDNFAFIVQK